MFSGTPCLAAANILLARILMFSTEKGFSVLPDAMFGNARDSFVTICLPCVSAEDLNDCKISINPEESLSSNKKLIAVVKIPFRLH